MDRVKSRTTIGLKNSTKEKLDKNRAPGQCYDGFLCQLLDLWEETTNGDTRYKKREQGLETSPSI